MVSVIEPINLVTSSQLCVLFCRMDTDASAHVVPADVNREHRHHRTDMLRSGHGPCQLAAKVGPASRGLRALWHHHVSNSKKHDNCDAMHGIRLKIVWLLSAVQ